MLDRTLSDIMDEQLERSPMPPVRRSWYEQRLPKSYDEVFRQALDRARSHSTSAERFEQRVSFVYGQCGRIGWTKDQVRDFLRERR